MSAAVLVLVVLGVLAAMDAVSGTAGANQARTVAAVLAEEDQERLRGLATEELEDVARTPPAPRAVPVGNVTYTVASQAVWVSDAAGEEASCALDNGEGSYLRIRSTVTSPITGKAVPPVELTSIVAPRPGSGTLAAQVRNAAGQPLSGVSVAITGPEASTELTNNVGCAVFTGLDAGTYKATLNQAPWIGEDGKQLTVKTATVTAGNVSTVEFVYDRESSLNAQVYTRIAGVEVNDTSRGVIAANANVPAGFRQATPTTALPATNFAFTKMFPFANPYTLYAGTCPGADPSKLIPTYFDTNPSLVVTLAPGVPGPTVRVLEPSVDVRVTRSGVDRSGARVYAYPIPREALPDVVAECGPRTELTTSSLTTLSTGRLPATRVAGLPFGKYDLCATWIDTAPNPDRTYTTTVTNISNMTPNGMTVPIALPTSQSSSGCPTL